jgi:hypothetical protein
MLSRSVSARMPRIVARTNGLAAGFGRPLGSCATEIAARRRVRVETFSTVVTSSFRALDRTLSLLPRIRRVSGKWAGDARMDARASYRAPRRAILADAALTDLALAGSSHDDHCDQKKPDLHWANEKY